MSTMKYTEEQGTGDMDSMTVAEPQAQADMPKYKVLLLNLSFFGINAMYLVLCVQAVPAQIEAMVGSAYKGRWLGGMVGASAVLMFVAGPLVGMKSDRLVSRFGKRRPIMLCATVVLCFSLLGMAFSAPQIIIKKPPPNSTDGKCATDLVQQRCLPYVNFSLSSMGSIEHRGHVPQEGGVMPDIYDTIETIGAYEGNIGLFFAFFLLVTVSQVCFQVPYMALIADKSLPEHRGFHSGVMGYMILSGNICGAALGLVFVSIGIFAVYGCVIFLVLVCSLVTIFTTEEAPSKQQHEPISWTKVFVGFWEPLCEHDFRWVFLTRFLMQQGISTTTGFLEYWLYDMVVLPHCWSAQMAVSIVLVPMLCTAAIGSIVGGILSDKMGKRKILVLVAAMMMFSVAFILAFMQGDHAFYVAVSLSFFFGAGFGCFQSVDFALVMDVLPEDRDKAKDLAVWHQAMILPQALATPIGGILLDVFESINCYLGLGYIIIFLVSASYFFLSGVFLLKIRGAS